MITMAMIYMLIVMLIFLQDESAARVVYCTHEVNSRTCHASWSYRHPHTVPFWSAGVFVVGTCWWWCAYYLLKLQRWSNNKNTAQEQQHGNAEWSDKCMVWQGRHGIIISNMFCDAAYGFVKCMLFQVMTQSKTTYICASAQTWA